MFAGFIASFWNEKVRGSCSVLDGRVLESLTPCFLRFLGFLYLGTLRKSGLYSNTFYFKPERVHRTYSVVGKTSIDSNK